MKINYHKIICTMTTALIISYYENIYKMASVTGDCSDISVGPIRQRVGR